MKWERDILFCHTQSEILINSSTFMNFIILQPLAVRRINPTNGLCTCSVQRM